MTVENFILNEEVEVLLRRVLEVLRSGIYQAQLEVIE